MSFNLQKGNLSTLTIEKKGSEFHFNQPVSNGMIEN